MLQFFNICISTNFAEKQQQVCFYVVDAYLAMDFGQCLGLLESVHTLHHKTWMM